MMEEVVIDSFIEDVPVAMDTVAIDMDNFVASSFDEELSNMSVPSIDVGIEASDLGSLLEQFEEVSYDDINLLELNTDCVVPDLETEDKNNNRNASTERKELTQDIVNKIKPAIKPKTAVMLPLAVPAKRGRGRAMTRGHPVALPINCTPLRLQRVMMQHKELNEGLPEIAVETIKIPKVKKKDDNAVVDENYFELIIDHDYTKISSSLRLQSEKCPEQKPEQTVEEEVNVECDKADSKDSSDCDKVDSQESVEVVNDLEDGEVVEVEEIEEEKNKTDASKARKDKLGKNGDNVDYLNDGSFFDKLPSYCTALSIPRKSIRKTASHVAGRGGISVHDYMERNVSPPRDCASSGYSKLPDYYSSFTNSTKYDHMSSGSLDHMSSGSPEESKDSSGYSSLSISPSRRCSQSLTPERSRSRSRSRSYSRSQSRSRSRHSRSRSSCRRSRKDSDRRRSSYSPYSGYSSSSSLCSRSSCCRSSSASSSSSSSSSSSYCSTCDSRASSPSRSPSPSPSPDRAWDRERRFRGHRSRPTRHRSRSYSRSYSRGRSHRSRPRETYRSRSRSRSYSRDRQEEELARQKEMRREERKAEREEEKQMQMKERRIVYVGGLPDKYTRHELRHNFSRFGDIENVQLHFREHGDNYGFVTFAFTCDAYAAIEKGKRVADLAKFDLCFGGRRQFCDVEYADLDGNKEVEEEYDMKPKSGAFDFDELLRQARKNLKK